MQQILGQSLGSCSCLHPWTAGMPLSSVGRGRRFPRPNLREDGTRPQSRAPVWGHIETVKGYQSDRGAREEIWGGMRAVAGDQSEGGARVPCQTSCLPASSLPVYISYYCASLLLTCQCKSARMVLTCFIFANVNQQKQCCHLASFCSVYTSPASLPIVVSCIAASPAAAGITVPVDEARDAPNYIPRVYSTPTQVGLP